MLKWVKEILFGRRDSEEYHPEPSEPLKEVLPDISEPVHAIIKSIEKYPGRWKVRISNKDYRDGCFGTRVTNYYYEVKDKTTGVAVKGSVKSIYGTYYSSCGITYYSEEGTEFSWLTRDEKEAIHDAFITSNQVKVERLENIRKAGYNKQREKWKGIYCE